MRKQERGGETVREPGLHLAGDTERLCKCEGLGFYPPALGTLCSPFPCSKFPLAQTTEQSARVGTDGSQPLASACGTCCSHALFTGRESDPGEVEYLLRVTQLVESFDSLACILSPAHITSRAVVMSEMAGTPPGPQGSLA